MYNSNWYNSLNKPFLAPPDWLFMPVWTFLYVLIFISLILYLKDGLFQEKTIGLVFFTFQMLLNFAWSYVFFAQKNILGALIIASLMFLFILLNIIAFYKYSKLSAVLLIPYLLWTGFALYLNIGYYIKNIMT